LGDWCGVFTEDDNGESCDEADEEGDASDEAD
jgi:hypothetical protein